MASLGSTLLVILAGLVAVPAFVFFLEVFAAVVLPQPDVALPLVAGSRRRIAVLVPAHNESQGLLETLDDIRAQLHAGDRILVVADNCTDDTASVARAAGAQVTERHNPSEVGKGYALDWGVRQLSSDPPEVVIIIDADCRLANKALDYLAGACLVTGRPAQGRYLMAAPKESPLDHRVALFAFAVRNWIRPLGLRALKLPCQLTGTGMAFPWEVIRSANLATGATVEDLKLGLDLARIGKSALFCPAAVVNSNFPSSPKGAQSQRKRWEQGHLGMIAAYIPTLLCESFVKLDFQLLALSLDVAVPPLTLLGALVSLILAVSALAFFSGLSSSALFVSTASFSAYLIALTLCWFKFGRNTFPPNAIFSLIPYVVRKLPIYRQILSDDHRPEWIRTDRAKIITDRPDTYINDDDLNREVYCVLGMPLDATDMLPVLRNIKAAAVERRRLIISTPNVNFLVRSASDSGFRESLLFSDLCLPDGVPIVWIGRLLGLPIKKVSGSDMFDALKSFHECGPPLKVFLFGATEKVAAEASKRLNQNSRGLNCVGWLCPGFGSLDELSQDHFIEQINSSDADFLLASLGAQKGQMWLLRNHSRLRLPIRAHLGVTIHFAAGTVRRAPRTLQKLGLEWLWRVKEEPKLFARYWHDGSLLIWLLLTRILPLAITMRRLKASAERSGERFDITINNEDGKVVTIGLSGYATVKQVTKATEAFRDAFTTGKQMVIDLSNTQGADARFFGLLLMVRKQLKERGNTPNFAGVSSGLRRQFWLNGVDFLLAPAE